jgi:hypothetical protein
MNTVDEGETKEGEGREEKLMKDDGKMKDGGREREVVDCIH